MSSNFVALANLGKVNSIFLCDKKNKKKRRGLCYFTLRRRKRKNNNF